MDIDKLIVDIESIGANKKLSAWVRSVSMDAATALSTLQAENERMKNKLSELAHLPFDGPGIGERTRLIAENEKLRAELENYRKGHCSEGGCAAEKDRDAALADLERVKAERDAAIEDLRGKCSACANYTPYHNDGPCATCKFEIACFVPEKATDRWQWRGQKEDEHETG